MKEQFTNLPIEWINATVIEHFEEVVARYPQNIALNDGQHQLTYEELLSYVYTVANKLQNSKSTDGPVIILLENNVYFICAMLACLAVGRGYVPLDAGYAQQRNQQIISHCQAKTFISKHSLTRVFNIDDSYELIEFNSNWPLFTHAEYEINPAQLAYILYTSGSTGQPKGVFQNQRNLLHDVMQYINSANITADDRLSLLYSPSVNGAIRDIYGALLTGATLYIHNLSQQGVNTIPDFISKHALTIYHSIPIIFRTGLACRAMQNFNSVRLIYLAGDRIFKKDIDLYKLLFSDTCRVYIGIGSTENATIYRQWFIDKNTEIADGIVPVGYSVDDREMNLVNEEGLVYQVMVLGEIQVRSKYCALGYWKDELRTQQHFIQHDDGSRTVKTGDWGLLNTQGLLEFQGRRDGQVKINGFRVEIGEIESNIRAIAGVEDATILVRNQDETSKIVAYVVLQEAFSLEELKIKLEQSLSAQMFPSFFYQIEKMPYLSNFKLDYQEMQMLEKDHIERENKVKSQEDVFLKGEPLYLKERILNLWCQYASYESFKKDLTWKMGGGSSLEAVNFIVKVEQEFSIEFPNEWIHDAMKPSSIETQLKYLLGNIKSLVNSPSDDLIHVYAFPPIKGMIPETRAFLRVLGSHVPLTLVDYPRVETWKKEDICLENIANTIDKTLFEKGKLKIFIGHCSGDHVAFYLLNNLAKKYALDSLHFFIMDSWNISHTFKSMTLLHIDNFIARSSQLGLSQVLKESVNLRKKRVMKMLMSKDTGMQENYEYAQVKVVKECYPFKPMYIKSHLLISAEYAYSKDMGWRYYLPKLTTEILPFNHLEMYKEGQNQQVVLAKVLSFIDEIKEGHTIFK